MTDDTEVLSRLRVQATEEAPALTLQAEDVIRAGRRRQLRHRALGTGVGVAAAAAAVALVMTLAGSEPTSGPGSTDKTTRTAEPIPDEVVHAMPALLKGAALPPFDELPEWTSFRIDAFDHRRDPKDRKDPLPEARWGQATTWSLSGQTGRRTFGLGISSLPRAGLGTCESLAEIKARSCHTEVLPDGRALTTYWLAVPDQDWWQFVAIVVDDESLLRVGASASAWAPSLQAASDRLLLPESRLIEMASSPSLDLPGVVQPFPDETEASGAGE